VALTSTITNEIAGLHGALESVEERCNGKVSEVERNFFAGFNEMKDIVVNRMLLFDNKLANHEKRLIATEETSSEALKKMEKLAGVNDLLSYLANANNDDDDDEDEEDE
jgi:hypothetical protein